jgi:hypothetical protein
MAIEVKLSIAAITLEISAIALLFQHGNSNELLCGYFVLHALACVLITPVAWLLMPVRYHQPKFQVMILLFSLCFFIPILGLLGFVIAEIITILLPSLPFIPNIMRITQPSYQPTHESKKITFRLGRTHEQLNNQSLSLDLRMKALLTIQNTPTRYTSKLLRDTLGESFDDLRLLAYGILSSKEKLIIQRIHDALQRLRISKQQENNEASYIAARELAELYWELTYQKLVQGGIFSYALEQVQYYVTEAAHWCESDSGLRVLSGRAHLLAGDLDSAVVDFSTAMTLGMPQIRIQPYLAEVAFLKRDYAKVRQLMHQNQTENRMPLLRQVTDYWD